MQSLVSKCKKVMLGRYVGIFSIFQNDHKLTRNLNYSIIKTSLNINRKFFQDSKSSLWKNKTTFNHDAVLLETLIFVTCFSQASLKRSFSDMWDVKVFEENLKTPAMKTGASILNKLIIPNYYDWEQMPSDINLMRISEYFKNDAIDKFITNIVGVIEEEKLLPEYKNNNAQKENIESMMKLGLGKILANHHIKIISIVG